ncbi:MAG TPA: hypothetical protein VGM17_02445 [Rhizomicrobium sp.]|jgi:hypothetical protein
MQALLFAAALASANVGGSYYLQSSQPACASIAALVHRDASCTSLPKSARVMWDGKIIDGFVPRYLGGNVARVTADHRIVFVYANFLSTSPPRDLLRREFILAHASLACPAAERFADALEAEASGDRRWFADTGCQVIPRGLSAARLAPVVDGAEAIWRMRVRFPHSAPQILWMQAADFR